MSTRTIEFGIDLGTTNSALAWLRGVEAEVIKNLEGGDITPSVVRMISATQVVVGARAKRADDLENVVAEFKRKMGNDFAYPFPRAGVSRRPEELSAEVLKVLRAAASSRAGYDVDAAVITVPAAFLLPQNEATRLAAIQAGFRVHPLVQEPVAAAMAYGFQAEGNSLWLVYDFGGGTFDAAVTAFRDEMCHVVNHAGDNDLGGQLLDWGIVEQLLAPAVAREHGLVDFHRQAPRWTKNISKLKLAAEDAKIALSAGARTAYVEARLDDGNGGAIDFAYDLSAGDVERIADPLIDRTIRKCREALSERSLGPDDVDKLILVGGPTQMPYLRARLKGELGIELRFDRDPFTVVAQGAAIFAGTQLIEDDPTGRSPGEKVAPGTFSVTFGNFTPQGADPEPMVGGVVASPLGGDLSDHAIQFFNRSIAPTWSSERVGLAPNGAFLCQLFAERGRENLFEIAVTDGRGTRVPVAPDSIRYRIGASVSAPPLIHTVVLELDGNEVDVVGLKGSPLPIKFKGYYRCLTEVKRGGSSVLRIPIREGQSKLANRNRLIGQLVVPRDTSTLRRDIPAGAEIEVEVEIDRSRIVTLRAEVPSATDEIFEEKLDYRDFRAQALDAPKLEEAIAHERKRLEAAAKRVEETGDTAAEAALQRIYTQRLVAEVEQAQREARTGGPEAAQRCEARLFELMIAIDSAEELLAWPLLVRQAEKEIEEDQRIARGLEWEATPSERAEIDRLEEEARSAIRRRDPGALRQAIRRLDEIGTQIVIRSPGWWVARLNHLADRINAMSDTSSARKLIEQGNAAARRGELDDVKNSVRQLWRLLPTGDVDRPVSDLLIKA